MKNVRQAKSVPMRKNYYEKEAWGKGVFLSGIDEAGRGSHAGPVVAAAVVVPAYTTYRLLKDSKILSVQEREIAYQWIIKHCIYGVGIINQRLIEQHNIYQATIFAMKKAILMVERQCPITMVLIDAVKLSLTEAGIAIPIHSFPYGEYYSTSIAAASIVAKVTRDRIMERFETIFPGYLFKQHKGYGTELHKTAIQEKGMCIIHRETYVKLGLSDLDQGQQKTLFSP